MLNHSGSNNSGLREERRAVFSEISNDEGNKRPMTTSVSHKGKSMPAASGDARLPNLVCVSDLQLESKLTEDFRKEMEKQRKSNYEPKSTKWSYTGALQSLQNFMENEDTDKDNFSKSDVGEEQNTNKSTGHTRNDDDQNKDIKADYGSLLETVGELLNQIYTKYSTVMLDGGGKNGTSHHLESDSRAELEMNCVSQEGSHAYSDHVKFKEEKLNITKKNFTTNQGKSSQNRGKYNSNNIEIVQKDRPKKEEMQTTLPRVEQCKTKEKNIQYPRSKWQPVEEDNEIEEPNRNIVKAELVKEFQECEEKLKELYSEESFSSDDESSAATSSECTEDSATENAESDYDSDSERYYGIQKPMVGGGYSDTDFGRTGDQRHSDDYGFYSQQQNTPEFVGIEEDGGYGNNMHGAHPTGVPNWYTQSHYSDCFKHWYQHCLTGSYAFHPVVDQGYASCLKHYGNYYEQAAKYYSDLANCYQTNCYLQDTYQLQRNYIKEMLKKE